MTSCKVCGTRTGQHGFSFDKQAKAQQVENKKQQRAGVLYIPKDLIPEEDRDEFLSQINDSTRPCAPEIRWLV